MPTTPNRPVQKFFARLRPEISQHLVLHHGHMAENRHRRGHERCCLHVVSLAIVTQFVYSALHVQASKKLRILGESFF